MTDLHGALVDHIDAAPDIADGILGMRDALRAVLELHQPRRIYDECGHEHTEEDRKASRAVAIDEVGYVCKDGYQYSICRSCCMDSDNDYQTEDCATYHDHGAGKPTCPTEVAIASALGLVSSPDGDGA